MVDSCIRLAPPILAWTAQNSTTGEDAGNSRDAAMLMQRSSPRAISTHTCSRAENYHRTMTANAEQRLPRSRQLKTTQGTRADMSVSCQQIRSGGTGSQALQQSFTGSLSMVPMEKDVRSMIPSLPYSTGAFNPALPSTYTTMNDTLQLYDLDID